MKVTVLIARTLDSYRVAVIHISDKLTRIWTLTYPTADLCINHLVECGLASIFDETDFKDSTIHDEGGMLVHHTETDEETLHEAGFEERSKAN